MIWTCIFSYIFTYVRMYVDTAYTYYMLFDLSFYQYLVSEDYKEAGSFFDCRSPNAARFNWTSDGIKEFFVRDSCKDPWSTGRFRAVNLLGLLQIAVMHFVSSVSELLIMSTFCQLLFFFAKHRQTPNSPWPILLRSVPKSMSG